MNTHPAPAARPLALAVKLMYAGAALTVVALALDLLTAGSQRGIVQQEYENAHPGSQLSGLDLAVAVKVAVISLIIGASIRLLLWLWMAWKNGQGRRWARIVGTVFCVINLFSYTYLARETAGPQAITIIDMALGVVITVLMWLRSSSQYYAQRAAGPVAAGQSS
jgi:hypothetical protein